MAEVKKVNLDGSFTVVAGPRPPSDAGFHSTRVQVLHWVLDDDYADDVAHRHGASDEIYVVLVGSVDVVADGVRIRVQAGEALAVPAGVTHQLVAVQPPARGLTIRGPAIEDKQR